MSARQGFVASAWPAADRLELWKGFFRDTVGGVRAEARGEFEGRVVCGELGALTLCRLHVGSHRIARTPELIRRKDGQDLVKVVFQVGGVCTFEQDGQEVSLSPGEWSFYDTGRPYQVSNTAPTEQLIALVPRALLVDGNLHLGRCAAGAYPAQSGLGRVLRTLLESAFDELDELDSGGRRDIGDAAAELVRKAVFDAVRGRASLSVREMWVDRIRTYVDRNLRNPDLSVEQTAAALEVSTRYIHKLFGEGDETLGRYILRSRLERCREDLGDPARAAESITAIAFSWGFNDASHFSHAFKKHFGASPTDLRAAGMKRVPA